jgi:hypothetical protein
MKMTQSAPYVPVSAPLASSSTDFVQRRHHPLRFNGDQYDNDDAGWQPVAFQVADCRHGRKRAAKMIAFTSSRRGIKCVCCWL